MQVEIFEVNEKRKFQKILKVKSPYQSEIQGKGNLGANKKFLGSQNLHGSRELFFTMAQINKFWRSNYFISLTQVV